jgi:serpin B
LVQDANRFGLKLYNLIHAERGGNVIISPYSLSSALTMTSAGAAGETGEQMRRVLGEGLQGADAHPAFAWLTKRFSAGAGKRPYELSIANGLWVQQGKSLKPRFRDLLRTAYAAELRQLEFGEGTERARAEINDWASQKTRGKITELLGPSSLPPNTRLVLTNAVYLKATWERRFDPEQTAEGDFHVGGGQKVQTKFMYQVGKFLYREGDGYQSLELPYAGGHLSMLLVLPSGDKSLDGLTPGVLEGLLSEVPGVAPGRVVEVYLPRFRAETALGLKATLERMGMPLAFSSQADFSGIDGQRDLTISDVFHKTYVDVNEAGTEAAAASGVVIQPKGMLNPEAEFRADRPFVFFIRDIKTGTVLFMGSVLNPAAGA